MKFIVNLRKLIRWIFAGVFANLSYAAFGFKSLAATDDRAFNICQQIFSHDNEVLKGVPWHSPPLEANIQKAVKPLLDGDSIIRWISYENKNGIGTVVVLTRSPEPQVEEDNDFLDVMTVRHGITSIQVLVAANGFAFTKNESKGMQGLIFCTAGGLGPEWIWDGHSWN